MLLCDEEAAGDELLPEWLCAACEEPPQAVTSAMTAPNMIARRRREVMGLLPVEWMYQLSGGFTDSVPVRFTAAAAPPPALGRAAVGRTQGRPRWAVPIAACISSGLSAGSGSAVVPARSGRRPSRMSAR